MKFFLSSLAVFAATSAADEQAGAEKPVELMVMYDSTNGNLRNDDSVVQAIQTGITDLMTQVPSMRVAVSDFADKPNVHVGVGTFGGYPGEFIEDYCYRQRSAFSTQASDVTRGFKAMEHASGMDQLEGHFEALLRGALDSTVGWSADSHRVIFMVTDAYGHSQALNTLTEHVMKFNTPVRCTGDDQKTAGGIGAYKTADSTTNWINAASMDKYTEFADLVYRKNCVGDLTDGDRATLNALKPKFAPLRVPSVKPFDLETLKSDPEEHCRFHEYPAYSDIATVFEAQNITLVVYLHGTGGIFNAMLKGWKWILSDAENALGGVSNKLFDISAASDGNISKLITSQLSDIIASL